jgi:sugar phosphate isomerase/epimerase
MIAPKLFSTDDAALQKEIMDYTLRGYGIEVAIYEYEVFSEEIVNALKALPTSNKMLHLWHKKVYLKGLVQGNEEVWRNFIFEAKEAERMGIKTGILHHMTSYDKNGLGPMTDEEIVAYAIRSISTLSKLNDFGVKPFLENTHEQKHFHEIFFNTLERHDALDLVGFCLDTGHTRAFAKESLDDWLDFVGTLVSRGVHIHYHVHVNHGEIDEHLTLCRGSQTGLLDPIEGWTKEGFLNWFNRAMSLTPNAIFCQEHSSKDAYEAIGYVEFLVEDGVLELPPIK